MSYAFQHKETGLVGVRLPSYYAAMRWLRELRWWYGNTEADRYELVEVD